MEIEDRVPNAELGTALHEAMEIMAAEGTAFGIAAGRRDEAKLAALTEDLTLAIVRAVTRAYLRGINSR